MADAMYQALGFTNGGYLALYALVTTLLGVLSFLAWRGMTKPAIPTINSADSEFISNARDLIKEGVARVR